MAKGLLFVLSGFSGAGKGTIMKRFFEAYDGFALSVSATTRKMREGEQEGVHYFFKEREEFEEMIAAGQLIEYTQYQENYYGTPKDYVLKKLEEGLDVILEIEVDGASKVEKKFPDATLIFVTTPTPKILEERLRGRGTNTEEEIRGRLKRAEEEAAFIPSYDYLLVNDDLEACVQDLYAITRAEHLKEKRMETFAEGFRKSLAEREKGEPTL